MNAFLSNSAYVNHALENTFLEPTGTKKLGYTFLLD